MMRMCANTRKRFCACAHACVAGSRFIAFKAERAQCFRASDRDRLLAIIESAFGTFEEFDNRVRVALVAK